MIDSQEHKPLKNILVLSPHPDDELIGLGFTLLKQHEQGNTITVIYTSNGAPQVPEWYPVGGCNNPEEYLEKRKIEAARALEDVLGIPAHDNYFLPFADYDLSFCLPALENALKEIFSITNWSEVYVPAFEGGHPDHDATHLAAVKAYKLLGAPFYLYEYAEYGLDNEGKPVFNTFTDGKPDTAISINLSTIEQYIKEGALLMHETQNDDWMKNYLRLFRKEQIRPMQAQDYRQKIQLQENSETYYEKIYGFTRGSEMRHAMLAYLES
jgi:LmbE family N-acetylglucosaminyl deacetylase